MSFADIWLSISEIRCGRKQGKRLTPDCVDAFVDIGVDGDSIGNRLVTNIFV